MGTEQVNTECCDTIITCFTLRFVGRGHFDPHLKFPWKPSKSTLNAVKPLSPASRSVLLVGGHFDPHLKFPCKPCVEVHLVHLTMAAYAVNRIRTANFEMHRISSIRHYLFCSSLQNSFRFRSFATGLLLFPPLWMSSALFKQTSEGSGSDLLKIYTPSRKFRSSADSRMLCIPPVSTKSCGERSFSYIVPTLWKTLPKKLDSFSQLFL